MIKKLSKKFNFWIGVTDCALGGYLLGTSFSCKRKILAFIGSIWCIFIGYFNIKFAMSDVIEEFNKD